MLRLLASTVGPGDRILVAAGHGRSYGAASRFLARSLPSILDCGLWRELSGPPAATWLAVTDVGNDLAYGHRPRRVAEWVESCVLRSAPVAGRALLVLLPEETLARLPPWRWTLARALLFPGRRFPRGAGLASVAELNARLRELAARLGLAVVAPDPEWLGADAIHLRRRRQRHAWRGLLAAWDLPEAGAPAAIDGRLIAARRSVCGLSLTRSQPTARLAGGAAVSLF